MKRPEISEKFTVEDIHAIREYNEKKKKKLSLQDRLTDIRKNADKCEKDIEKYRKTKLAM